MFVSLSYKRKQCAKKNKNSHITNTICIYVLRFVLYFFFCIFFRFRYLWFDVNHHLLFFYFIFLPDYYKYNIKIICIYVCFAYRWTQKLREQPFFCFSSFFFALLCCSVFSWYGRHFQLLLQKNRQRVEWKKKLYKYRQKHLTFNFADCALFFSLFCVWKPREQACTMLSILKSMVISVGISVWVHQKMYAFECLKT